MYVITNIKKFVYYAFILTNIMTKRVFKTSRDTLLRFCIFIKRYMP